VGNRDRVAVEFESRSYWLKSIESWSTKEILESCRKEYGPRWEKRFVEDIAEVLTNMGATPSGTVKLVLVDRETGKRRVVSEAPMTLENRRAVYEKFNAKR
jgi:hypothetical protein